MRRTLPKDAVRIIEGNFPWTRGDWRKEVTNRENSKGIASVTVPGILEMIDRIPEELLVFDSATDGLFTMALAALRANVAEAATNKTSFQWPAFPLPGQTAHEDCLVIVKNTLAACPEDVPSIATKGMTFISDAEFEAIAPCGFGLGGAVTEHWRMEGLYGPLWFDYRGAVVVGTTATFGGGACCGDRERRRLETNSSECAS